MVENGCGCTLEAGCIPLSLFIPTISIWQGLAIASSGNLTPLAFDFMS